MNQNTGEALLSFLSTNPRISPFTLHALVLNGEILRYDGNLVLAAILSRSYNSKTFKKCIFIVEKSFFKVTAMVSTAAMLPGQVTFQVEPAITPADTITTRV